MILQQIGMGSVRVAGLKRHAENAKRMQKNAKKQLRYTYESGLLSSSAMFVSLTLSPSFSSPFLHFFFSLIGLIPEIKSAERLRDTLESDYPLRSLSFPLLFFFISLI